MMQPRNKPKPAVKKEKSIIAVIKKKFHAEKEAHEEFQKENENFLKENEDFLKENENFLYVSLFRE